MNKMTKTLLIMICAMLLKSASRAEAESVLQKLQRDAGPDAVAATLAVPLPAASEVLPSSQGSSIRWSRLSASCGEYTPDNHLIKWVHSDKCRRSQEQSSKN